VIAFTVYIFSVLVLSLPGECIFCFTFGWGLNGLWEGYSLGLAMALVLYLWIIYRRLNWTDISEEIFRKSFRQFTMFHDEVLSPCKKVKEFDEDDSLL
jgi:hypothetical protein